jgi:putative spermidine/putrescine transport system permease protein
MIARTSLGLLPAILLVGLVFMLPLLQLVGGTFFVDGTLTFDRYADLAASPAFSAVASRTVVSSGLVTLICLLLGYPLAYWMSRATGWRSRVLFLAVTVPFLASVLVRSYAWIAILGDNGIVNSALQAVGLTDRPVRLVFNEIGSFVGMVQIQLPVMVLALYSVMRTIDYSLLQSAVSLGASPTRAFGRVFLPLSMPGVIAGSILTFIISLGFYVTPALLGGSQVYWLAQAINVRVVRLADFPGAATQATVLLGSVLLLMLIFRGPLGMATSGEGQSRTPLAQDRTARTRGLELLSGVRESSFLALEGLIAAVGDRIGRWASAAVAAIAIFILVAPMVVIGVLAFSDDPFLKFPPNGYSTRWFESYFATSKLTQATLVSVFLAAAASIVATIVGTIASFSLTRSRSRLNAGAQVVLISPLVIPSIVIAVALLFAFAPTELVGSPLLFIAVYSALAVPYSIVIMSAVLRRFDVAQEHAAMSLGANRLRTFWLVVLPAIAAGVVSSLTLTFLVSFDEVVIALYLNRPPVVTLPVLMFQEVTLNLTPRIASIAVSILAIGVVVLLVSRGATRGYQRVRAHLSASNSP